jgi:hypothetical protein
MSYRNTLSRKIAKLGKVPSLADSNKITEQQHWLLRRINKFSEDAKQFIGISSDDNDNQEDLPDYYSGSGSDSGSEAEEDEEEDEDDNSSASGSADDNDSPNLSPENSTVPLPSSLGLKFSNSPNFLFLVKQELQLRVGEANDALHELRLGLGHKAFLFRTTVRHANSQKKKLRAFSSTAAAEASIKSQFHIYSGARRAMISLGASADVLLKYKEISKDHLKITTITHDPSIHGQRNSHLPWFWRMDANIATSNNEWMSECMYHPYHLGRCLSDTFLGSGPYQFTEYIGLKRRLASTDGMRNFF